MLILNQFEVWFVVYSWLKSQIDTVSINNWYFEEQSDIESTLT